MDKLTIAKAILADIHYALHLNMDEVDADSVYNKIQDQLLADILEDISSLTDDKEEIYG